MQRFVLVLALAHFLFPVSVGQVVHVLLMFRAWALLASVVLVAQALKAHQPLLLAVRSGRFLRVVWAAA